MNIIATRLEDFAVSGIIDGIFFFFRCTLLTVADQLSSRLASTFESVGCAGP